jgi:urease accessory protein
MLWPFSLILPAMLIVVSPAFAHTALGGTSGVAHGLMHPIGGVDHVLAMVAVGLFAALLSGRAVGLVPAAFLGMMAAGGALGIAGISLPFVEVGIGVSVIALGAAIALRVNPSVVATMGFVGFFAIFHGYAHGAEMPGTTSGLAYGIGFIVATIILHIVGIGLGLGIEQFGRWRAPKVVRAAGGAIAAAGVVLLVN